MKMDLNLFTVFDAIYCEGNITKAAAVLNLSQPAVSHALAKLRKHFDDPLFTRQGNRMRPTAVAQNVIADVREALHQLQVSLLQSRQFDPSTSRKHCRVSLTGALEGAYLPRLMKRLNAASAQLQLTSNSVRRSELENKLASGDIDLAIDILLPVNEHILHRQIAQDPLVVVARRRHPALSNGLDLATYLDQTHVLVSSRASGAGIEDFELGRLGLQRKVGLRCQHSFSACCVIAGNDMLLTLPETAAKMLSQVLNISIYPLPVTLPSIDVQLYWHLNVDKDPANKWLRDQVFAIAP